MPRRTQCDKGLQHINATHPVHPSCCFTRVCMIQLRIASAFIYYAQIPQNGVGQAWWAVLSVPISRRRAETLGTTLASRQEGPGANSIASDAYYFASQLASTTRAKLWENSLASCEQNRMAEDCPSSTLFIMHTVSPVHL